MLKINISLCLCLNYINKSIINLIYLNFQTLVMDEKKDIVGQQINGYKIIKPIGQGKFSTVYQAQNLQGVLYALKKIKIFDMMDPKQRQKCLKQVDLMKPLLHPNIIRYIDNFTFNNQLIIVTQWAQKGDLKRLIKDHQQDQTPFQQIRIWDFLIQISSALKHMHEKKIMHRDLKPANIFIANDQSLKIGDLGLGRAFGSETIQAHSKVGTPLYMPPQLLRDQGYQMNADVWSLGCICYQLAQLRSPFRNQNQKMSLMELFNNITKGQFKPISNRYSQQLSDIVKKMIVADPNKRISSSQVLQISQQNFGRLKKTPKIDCFITMDDIVSKLNLIDYALFCKLSNHKTIHRAYFALKQQNKQPNQQLYYFLQLSYWIMNLSKLDKSKQKAILHAKTMIDWKSTQQACAKFLNDLISFGIKHELSNKHIFQGYGQNVCYLLNQLLNRQLIRVNFKFQSANLKNNSQIEKQEYLELQVDEQRQIRYNKDDQQQMEQTLEFERSMLFKRGKKMETDNQKLLDKIKQIDEQDVNILQAKVDAKQWEKQCIRVQKQLGNIHQQIKESKKDARFQNFQRIKITSGTIKDSIRYVQPIGYKIYNNTEFQLQKIKKGEKRINEQFKKQSKQFSIKNEQKNYSADRLKKLNECVNEQTKQMEQIQLRLQNIELKIIGQGEQKQPSGMIRQAIKIMKNEIRQLNTRRGLLQWQLRQRIKNRNVKQIQMGDEQF